MKRYIVKIIFVMLITFYLLIQNSLYVFAAKDFSQESYDDGYVTDGEDYSSTLGFNPNEFDPSKSTEDPSKAIEKASVILTVIQVIGIVIAVISLMVIGIKFMYGSVEEKAQYKQTMIPWIIGVLMVVSVTSLPKIIASIAGIL